MVKLDNFSYDIDVYDDDDSDGKWVDVTILCKDVRDSAIITGALIRALGETNNIFNSRRTDKNESN